MYRLDEAVADVYRDLRLAPVLRRLLRHTGRLTGSAAGSVSLIDAEHGVYTKVAEYGASCRLGHSFPLDEGATGRAFRCRRPVVIPEYGRLRAGHLAAAHPARRGPAAAVPIWWRGDVIAVSVAFGPAADALSAHGVDDLEALAQSAAAAIVAAGRKDGSTAGFAAARHEDGMAGFVAAGREGRMRAALAEPDRHLANPLSPHPRDLSAPPFTPREAEVLHLLRQGLTYREMASRLDRSPKTVEKHVAAIMRKTGATNRTAAVVIALDHGWMGNLPHIG